MSQNINNKDLIRKSHPAKQGNPNKHKISSKNTSDNESDVNHDHVKKLKLVLETYPSDSESDSTDDSRETSTMDSNLGEDDDITIQENISPEEHLELLGKYEVLQQQHAELLQKFNTLLSRIDNLPGKIVLPASTNPNKTPKPKTNTNTDTTTTTSKTHKPPPLICYNIQTNKYIPLLKTTLGHNSFYFKIINKNITHIYTENSNDYKKVKSFLISHKNNFYTFTPPDEKHLTYLIKNLDSSFTIEDIKTAYEEEISTNNLNIEITKISKYLTPHMAKTNNSWYWLIQVTKKSDLQAFLKIRKILNSIITIEKLQKKDISQCRNCQRFGHSASNCHLPFRCVKCDTPHKRGACKTPTLQQRLENPDLGNAIPKCVNCGTIGHPANYRKCPKYIELTARIQAKKDKLREIQTMKTRSYNNFVRPTLSFSSITKPLPQTNIPRGNPQLATNTLGVDINNFSAKLALILPNLPKDPLQKKISLLAFITEFAINQ